MTEQEMIVDTFATLLKEGVIAVGKGPVGFAIGGVEYTITAEKYENSHE